VFWKSLDHQGLVIRPADKKTFAAKSLIAEINTKREEQNRQRVISRAPIPSYQFEFDLSDTSIIYDAARLLAGFVEHSPAYAPQDRQKLDLFIKGFLPVFFGLPTDDFERHVNVLRRSSDDEDMDDAASSAGDPPSTRFTRRGGNTKKAGDLLRGVLERGRNGKQSRKDKDGSIESKESTPDVAQTGDEEMGGMDGPSDAPGSGEVTPQRWIRDPKSILTLKDASNSPAANIKASEPYERYEYSLYCTSTIYLFFRLFRILYLRLSRIKAREEEVSADIKRRMTAKPANKLLWMDKTPKDYFADTSATAKYYPQVLEMCEDLIEGKLDMSHFEEALRYTYIQDGHLLYSIDKLLSALGKLAHNVVSSDVKEKSNEMVSLFMKDREKQKSTFADEIYYRKQVEKLARDDPVYRIAWVSRGIIDDRSICANVL
jgi:paired amphipathic helix protein Sin3a